MDSHGSFFCDIHYMLVVFQSAVVSGVCRPRSERKTSLMDASSRQNRLSWEQGAAGGISWTLLGFRCWPGVRVKAEKAVGCIGYS